MKNSRIDDKTPVGNPIKIEKKICLERSSVTRMVTINKVNRDKKSEMINDFLWFIEIIKKEKEKKLWFEFYVSKVS